MTPLQHKKLEALINTNRYDEARKFLNGLAAQGDKEAMTLRADMDITYPVTKTETADRIARRFLLYVFAGLAIAILLIAILLLVTKP